jgi:hypothetical protein
VEATIKSLATKDDLTRQTGEVRKEMAENKTDTIKWMFIFWIGQVGAMLAIMLLYLKK